jgi:hypothetical protein
MVPQPKSGPGLSFWSFVTITFLQGWIVSPAPNPPTWRTRPPYLWPPETGWSSYTPGRHWVPILVAFYDMSGLQWDYSLIPVTTRNFNTSLIPIHRLVILSYMFHQNPSLSGSNL